MADDTNTTASGSANSPTGDTDGHAPNPPAPRHRWRRLDYFGISMSLLAFVVSGISLYVSYVTGNDVANVDAIKTEYALFSDFAKLQYEHPLMSHLFAFTPEQYRSTAGKIAEVAATLDQAKRTSYRLEEQGIANFIFTSFEETFYYWTHAGNLGDSARLNLLDGDMDYFVQQMCNPRLAWYWSPTHGMRLALNFSGDLQRYVAKRLATQPCVAPPDPKGPFG